jgi:hypothetical protein
MRVDTSTPERGKQAVWGQSLSLACETGDVKGGKDPRCSHSSPVGTTAAGSTHDHHGAKPVDGLEYKPFPAVSRPTATAACDYTERPEVKARSAVAFERQRHMLMRDHPLALHLLETRGHTYPVISFLSGRPCTFDMNQIVRECDVITHRDT